MKNVLFRNNMHMMTQVLRDGDRPHLPHNLSVVNTYTKMMTKWVVVVVKNLPAILITITKGIKVTKVVVTNVVPPVELVPRT